MENNILCRDFYMRAVHAVARDLLGKTLVSTTNGSRIAGTIYETEAYDGEQDLACHARSGKTARTAVMYSEGGHAYIYFTYGLHWMFNCVAGASGYPAAVLIRAIQPIEGIDIIRDRRQPIDQSHWCDGPAKMTKSLGITGMHNGMDMCQKNAVIYIEEGCLIPEEKVKKTPRIGLGRTPEPWKSKLWRYVADIS